MKPWDPFDHSEGQFSLHVEKSEKYLEVGSQVFPAPAGKKVRKELKTKSN